MDTNSKTEATPEIKPKRRFWRYLLRGILILFGLLIVAGIVAHLAWKYSGSGQWRKVEERKGVVIYAMKTPGETLEQFKAVWTVNSKLSRFARWATDEKGTSMRREVGLYDLKVLARNGDRQVWTAWKQPLIKGLKPREFVIKSEFNQDPKTKTLFYTVKAVTDRLPPDDCCVRVELMDNKWTLTPMRNGQIQMEWAINMDIGGTVPYFLQNAVQPQGMLRFAPKVEKLIEMERYRDAKYDWIEEPAP